MKEAQKFTFENFVLLLQSLHGHQNDQILRSIKYFKKTDFESFLKEYKFLLDSTKIKELIRYEKYLRKKVDNEEYKEGYKELSETISKYNIITGLKNIYDDEKLFNDRDFDVGTLEPRQLKIIEEELRDKFFMRKRTKLDLKFIG